VIDMSNNAEIADVLHRGCFYAAKLAKNPRITATSCFAKVSHSHPHERVFSGR